MELNFLTMTDALLSVFSLFTTLSFFFHTTFLTKLHILKLPFVPLYLF